MNNRDQALPKDTILRGKVYTYRIEKVLGQGTFGITYLASTSMQGPLGEVTVQVAVKEFFAKELDSRMADGTVTARTEDGVAHKYARAFLRESENLSKMKHPGIVNVLESFEDKGTCYYSMEYLSGGSLDDKVKGRGIPEQEALNLTTKIGEALSYMHERKVMHLDLKPKNVMLKADGSPVIIDFGLSKQFDEKGEPESSTTIGLGTPGYAPIEQANQTTGRMFQPTIDIYALGATLYKMLTGETPPSASDIFNEGFPEESLVEEEVSQATVNAVRKAMSAAKKDRPQSVAEFLNLLAGEEGTTVEEPPTKPNPRPTPKPEPKPSPKPVSKPKPTQPTTPPEENISKVWLWVLIGGAVAAAIIVALILGRLGKNGGGEIVNPVDTTAVAAIDPQTNAITPDSKTIPEPVAPGSVKVSSTPSGATIWLDGKNTKKTTPEIIEDITPGKHSVKLVLEGYNDYSGSETITSDKRAELSQTLKEKADKDNSNLSLDGLADPVFTPVPVNVSEDFGTRVFQGKIYFDENNTVENNQWNEDQLKVLNSLNQGGIEVTSIAIEGWASPWETLSDSQNPIVLRTKALRDLFYGKYNFPKDVYRVNSNGEYWDSVIDYVYNTNEPVVAENRSDLLNAIASSNDFDKREAAIKKIAGGKPYKKIFDAVYPRSRFTGFVVTFQAFYDKAHVMSVYNEDPSSISSDEYVLWIQDGAPAEAAETAVKLYPNDVRVAVVAADKAYVDGDVDKAIALYKKAGSTKEVMNNLACCYIKKGDYESAKACLAKPAKYM